MAGLADWRATLLIAVIGAGLLVAPEPVWAMLVYLGVLLPWGWRLLRHPPAPDGGTIAGVALILWFTLATAWDRTVAPQHLLWVWNGLNTLVFFLAARAVLGASAGRERLITVLIACGLANVAVAFARLAVLGVVPGERMNGWAETRHPILGAAVIGLCVILAAARLLQRRRGAWLNAAMVVAGLAFILGTGSRGPLVAVAGGLGVLLFGMRWRWLVALAAALVAGVVAVAATPNLAALARSRLLDRGWSSRFDIWRLALHEIAARPLLGYGPAARLDRAVDNFPHDLFLSMLFYSGAVGLLLLLALLAWAVWSAWRQGADGRWVVLALLANTVLNGLTDLSQITKGPSPMWYIVWLPVVLALGQTAPAAARSSDHLPHAVR